MAAGAPGAAFGGGHVFIDDPNDAGISTITRDMAAINLQLLHFVRATAHNDDHARIDEIADRVRQTLAASTASQARERATRELQPITRVPAAEYGVNVNVANIRMHNIPTFSGNGSDSLDVIRWLGRILALAQSNQLTFASTILLLIQGSTGGAADYIEQMREEGKTIHQIVQQMEMRYGDLCTPEEARVKCNNMPRKEKEGLPEFIDRLRSMARMACRLLDDDVARRRAIDVLVEGNIRRVLPASVRNALEERVINRSRMGLPAFSAREIEKECLDLERRREERRNVAVEPAVVRKHVKAVQQLVNHMSEAQAPQSGSSEDDYSSADEADTGDEAVHHLVNEIKQQERRFAARGQPIDPQRVYKKAFRRFNDKFPPPRYPRNPNQGNYGARQAGVLPAPMGVQPQPQQPQPGPPNRLYPERKTILELLALANCTKGHCIQCGAEGHYMHAEACALKDRPLVDKPCAKCGTGLHSADYCPRVFQQPYVAAPQPLVPVLPKPAPPGANLVMNEVQPHLNDN